MVLGFLFGSAQVEASFIESSMGAAVVNDATATYYNPAALTLLKNSEFIALGSLSNSYSQFTGQSTQISTANTQRGVAYTRGNYYLPSLYLGSPITQRITTGLALVANDFNRSVEDHSILRYAQANNQIKDIDLVTSLGFKWNPMISFGLGFIYSKAAFLLEPTTGFASLNIPDAQSHNKSQGTSWGGNLGLLVKPGPKTTIGLNYRTALTYPFSGSSTFNGQQSITSNDYHFKYWTPARSVFSINQLITDALGIIGTIQYIQWDIFKAITFFNVATQSGNQAIIVPRAQAIYDFHNTWLVTLGTHYRFSPDWIIRIAGNYNQSPSEGKFQIDSGDTITLGGSISYQLSKVFTLDGSYAHAFSKNALINASKGQNRIIGNNKSSINAISLKLIARI